ncbi:18198_t:CDS:2, partial [Racocetra persica]
QLACRHKIGHASSVEHYGVMNDRPNTPAPEQENKGKIPVKALIDTISKSNTISKCLYNKLEKDYGLEGISGDDLIGKEIKYLDLQFRYKGKWRSLDGTEVIDFQICKNPSFDLRYAKIEIDDMSILLIEEDSRPTGDSSSYKASSTKNNLSIAEQAVLWNNAQEEVINIINKILSNIEDRLEGSDSESTDSDWYNLNPIKPQKKRQSFEYLIHCIHIKKKKVVSPIRKHHKNKYTNCVRIPDYVCDEVKIDTHSLQYQSFPPGLLLIPEKAVYLYP